MNQTNINKIKKAVIREDLLSIVENYKEAIILGQFIYWSERVDDADKFIKAENEIARKNGETEREPLYGWIYKTAEELADEIMLGLSASQIRKYIAKLVDYGYIQKRNNPKYKWDRTLQYKVNLVNIAKALKANGYSLNDYKISIPDSNAELNPHQCAINESQSEHQASADSDAIPETTSETTNKDCNSETTNINAHNSKELGRSIHASRGVTRSEGRIPYINPDNCTQQEFHDFILAKSMVFCKKHQGNEEAANELAKIIEYFYKQYGENMGEKHPILSDKAFENVAIRYLYPPELLDSNDIYEFEYYQDMIDKYFMTDYGRHHKKKYGTEFFPELSLSHFMSDEIRTNLAKKAFQIPY